MLKLDNIVKDYIVAGKPVRAVRGISVNFRKKEFVSVLGPSGCGKTTLLNIIGGLDQYTSGDLLINGRSTKDFSDRDWDIYRNHRIGFVFQTYNLIPHQTVLGNVELALTIAGCDKQERIEKAKRALDRVGLKNEYYKKPNQLSGGQQQRVAIARAIVNDPEILLADEPTGALDTKTSVQIMDLIKEIAKDRLVIMVTHNPELAEKYSTRIVRLLDGELIEDTDAYDGLDDDGETYGEIAEKGEDFTPKKSKKSITRAKESAKMGLFTSFKLSFKNLVMKLKRTVLVIIAGSIGIIGVSSVLAVSQGVKDYLADFQDDLLSGNPITIEKSGVDYTSLMNASSFFSQYKAIEHGKVNVNSIIDYLVSNENALEELRYTNDFNTDYINYVKSMPKEYYNDILLDYGVELLPSIYTDFKAFNNPETEEQAKFNRRMSLNAITETYTALLEMTDYGIYSSYITSLIKGFSQGVGDNDYIAEQYDILYGELPKNYNDIVVVLSESEQLGDLLLAQLGYYTEEEFYNLIYKAGADYMQGEYKKELDKTAFEYEEIVGKRFTWYPNDVIYTDTSTSDYQVYDYNYEEGEDWTGGIDLKICAIVKPKKGLAYGALESGFIYSEDFIREVIKNNINSVIAEKIRNRGSVYSAKIDMPIIGETDIGIHYDLAYTYFDEKVGEYIYADGGSGGGHDNAKKVYVGESSAGIMNTFMSYIGSASGDASSESIMGVAGGLFEQIANSKTMGLNSVGGTYLPERISIYPKSFEEKYLVTDYLDRWNYDGDIVLTKAKSADLKKLECIGEIDLTSQKYKYLDFTAVSATGNITLKEIAVEGSNGKIAFGDARLIGGDGNAISGDTVITAEGVTFRLDVEKSGLSGAKTLKIYAGGNGNGGAVSVTAMGLRSDSDGEVGFYNYKEDLSDYGDKDVEIKKIALGDRTHIKYSDQVELVVNMINNVINVITIALIVFTSLALLVSTVMVAIITYVSVVERVKEIGVIRSLGGRKKDVARLFNVETFVIGLSSGLFGIAFTLILSLIGNLIVKSVSDGTISAIARLTPINAVEMVLVSVVLTLISGLIPASSAAKKNPVDALRSE